MTSELPTRHKGRIRGQGGRRRHPAMLPLAACQYASQSRRIRKDRRVIQMAWQTPSL